MIEEQLKFFLDNNFNDEDKFSLIKANGLSAIMENYYSEYPLSEFARNMKSNNRVIHIVKQGQMVKLIKDFNHNDISVLYFKGEVLQSLLFENVDVRPAGDIDIYVVPDKFNTAMSVLKENGFVFRNSNTINNNHHVQYVKGHIKLELHKNLFNPFTKINETIFFDHLIPYQCKGYSCLTFDKTATILHLFYHLYMDTLLSQRSFDSNMKNNAYMAKRFLFILPAGEIAPECLTRYTCCRLPDTSGHFHRAYCCQYLRRKWTDVPPRPYRWYTGYGRWPRFLPCSRASG